MLFSAARDRLLHFCHSEARKLFRTYIREGGREGEGKGEGMREYGGYLELEIMRSYSVFR